MPFHHPVRLAEDIAVVDVIAGGRFELGVGVGYKVEEFASFGVPFTERGARTNEALGIVRRLLDGETVTLKNQFFDLNKVKITPAPIQRPHPPLWIGGFTPAALRRAVRYGDGFTVPDATRDVYDRYIAALTKAHRPIDNVRFASGFQWLIVSHDPERTFNEAADHILYQANNYTTWLAKAGLMPNPVYLRDREQLRQSGLLKVVEPETAITMIRDYISAVPVTHYYAWTLPPGLPPRWAQAHLELFASQVIPAFR
jgi:alkanesulfonate monooxygenase SsuD/methylene tetrahydromethanopterin reductase-like flavin-dependent oxidoreductase (luciferase family)